MTFAACYQSLVPLFSDTPANTIVLGLLAGVIFALVNSGKTKWVVVMGIVGALSGLHPASFLAFSFGGAYVTLGLKQLDSAIERSYRIWLFALYPILGLVSGYLFHLIRITEYEAELWEDLLVGAIGGSIPVMNLLFCVMIVPVGLCVLKGSTVGHLLSLPFSIIPLFALIGGTFVRISPVEKLLRCWFHLPPAPQKLRRSHRPRRSAPLAGEYQERQERGNRNWKRARF